MKPAPFSYIAARDIDQALSALTGADGDAKILAGGQSLMPILNFRLVKPSVVVDINRITGLDRIEEQGDRLVVGALVRHRTMATDERIKQRFPVIHHAMKHVAHYTVRNRGTFVGSVCHADPAAEMPMIALLLDAVIRAASLRGERRIPARDFFLAPLTTSLEPDELVTGIELPFAAPNAGWAFEEFALRDGDFALAAVAVLVDAMDASAAGLRIAMMGIGDVPVRLHEAEQMLVGGPLSTGNIAEAVKSIRDSITPNTDSHASADYRRHLAGILATRALADAWARTEKAER